MENLKEICEKASQLYANKNYAEAVSLWKNAAEQGSSDALYMLGICYNYKLGVNEDDSEKCGEIASDYFIKAANLGHADAQCFAGLCYLCLYDYICQLLFVVQNLNFRQRNFHFSN